MKKINKITLVLALVAGIGTTSFGQDYENAIGLRGGLSNGVTFKHFITERHAIEGIFTTRWRGAAVTGIYEIHHGAFDVDRLNWYYGAGAHVGFYNGRYTSWGSGANESYAVIGVDLMVGIEYNFTELPINISLDYKPAINLIGYSGFWADEVALSVRYTFSSF